MKLDAGRITDAASQPLLPWKVEVRDEVASTSDVIRELGQAGGPHGLVVLAERQTAGRGRRDNRWQSLPGRDLMLSVLLRPPAQQELWPRITSLAALAVCKAVESELPLRPRIKWPNDIYLNDRKICGLLAEACFSSSGTFLCLGIGINVNSTGFPADLAATATSLCLEMRGFQVPVIDRNSLAACLLRHLAVELERMDGEFPRAMGEVRERSWLLGKTIRATVLGREVFGRAADLNHEGHLVIVLPDGSSRDLSSADEVRWVMS